MAVGDQEVILLEAGALGAQIDDKVVQHAADGRLHDLYGPLADRPAPDPNQAGRRYWAYDAGGVYRDTGGAWEEVPTRPSPHRDSHKAGGGDALTGLELSQFAAGAKNPTDPAIPALRSLGAASFEAAAGNDPRLKKIYSSTVLLPDRRKLRIQGAGQAITDDAANDQLVLDITGAGAGPASRTALGLTEYADDTEAQDPNRQDRAIDPAGLQAEITRRLTPEAWHAVGAAGKPAFQNGATNRGGGFEAVGFFKDPVGRVHLRGTLANFTAVPVTVFTLPVGYRPGATLPFAVARLDGNTTPGRVEVRATGEVVVTMGAASETSLNGISFRA